MRERALRCLALFLFIFVGLGAEHETAAAQQSRVTLRGYLGAGVMLSHDQKTVLGLDEGALHASLQAGYAVLSVLHTELCASGGYFFSPNARDGGLVALGLGSRVLIPIASDWMRFEGALHIHATWTGEWILPAIDLSVALAFAVTSEISVGPEISFNQVFWSNEANHTTDARFLTGGISLAWRPVQPPAPGPETRVVERVRIERVERDTYTRARIISPSPPPANAEEIERLLGSALPVAQRREIYLIPPVLFAFDSDVLAPAGEVALHEARALILESQEEVTVQGHADGRGQAVYNKRLSLARAIRVRDWLVAHGVEATRLSVEACGEESPLTDEASARGRQVDRRVTFRSVRIEEGAP